MAAAQISGGIFDVDRAVERLLATIEDAATQGVELVVFPECYIGGYPYWRGHASVKHETELAAQLFESSIATGGPEVDAIAHQVAKHGVAVVVGGNERDPRPGANTAYNSTFVFHPDDGYLGSRRKLVPTHTERAYWGRGDERDVRTFTLPFGEVGALICYEHHMLSARLAMALAGEEIHCALWPGYWRTVSHIADKEPGPAPDDVEIDAVVRNYAMSSQNFVVSANAYLRDDDIPQELREILGYNLARGGSSVVDASGRYLARPVLDEERLVVAEIDFWQRVVSKSYIDTVGHYLRPDVFDLLVGGKSMTAAAHVLDEDSSTAPNAESDPSHDPASWTAESDK
ncbi:MAG: nitrilase-related carbon-nitrogen hydrolase [Nocardioidaceae bacterium]